MTFSRSDYHMVAQEVFARVDQEFAQPEPPKVKTRRAVKIAALTEQFIDAAWSDAWYAVCPPDDHTTYVLSEYNTTRGVFVQHVQYGETKAADLAVQFQRMRAYQRNAERLVDLMGDQQSRVFGSPEWSRVNNLVKTCQFQLAGGWKKEQESE